MINLIPPVAKKRVVKEYWIRVITVWFFMASLALLLVLALQAPTYMLIKIYDKALITQFDNAEAMKEEFSNLEKEITEANELVDHLAPKTDPTPKFSELIYELDGLAAGTVELVQFSVVKEDGELNKMDVIGNANSRSALSKFRDAVEGHVLFESAQLPISNLAKDKDIVFSMKINMAKN